MAEVASNPNKTIFYKDILGPPSNGSNTWNIVNGSLYMNADPAVAKRWAHNVSEFVQSTDEQWIGWYGKLQAGPFNTDCLQGHQNEHPPTSYCRCATHPQVMPPAMDILG